MTLAMKAGFFFLLTLLVAAPFSSGGIMPGGALRIQMLCFASAAAAVLANRTTTPLPRVTILAILGITAVGVFQLLPLPPELLSEISPMSVAVYRETNEILQLFNRPALTPRISIAPRDTLRAILFVLSYLSAFVAGILLIRTRVQRTVVIGVLLGNCVVHVIYAARFQADQERIHSTFANPNHFAGYLELGL
ncbi:MAG: hypothetical protein ABI718_18045, partial [Acidobacteriota bacterium]